MKLNKLIAPSAALAMTVAVVHAQEAGMPGPPGVPAMAQGTMCRAYERIDGQLAFMKAELGSRRRRRLSGMCSRTCSARTRKSKRDCAELRKSKAAR